jgi:hypothetical protein
MSCLEELAQNAWQQVLRSTTCTFLFSLHEHTAGLITRTMVTVIKDMESVDRSLYALE